MHPIRQIIDDTPASIPVPRELQHRRVEVIFWPLDETTATDEVERDANGWPVGFFEATAGCLADDPIRRWPQGDYEKRLELE
jgi:hypothetical protein